MSDLYSILGITIPDITGHDSWRRQYENILNADINNGRFRLRRINTIECVVDLIRKSSKIMVLTGAGISVSGISKEK